MRIFLLLALVAPLLASLPTSPGSVSLATSLAIVGFVPRPPALALPPTRPIIAPHTQAPPTLGLPTVAPLRGWGWPLAGEPVVTRRFLNPPEPWRPGHRGVDLAAEPGAEVRAAAAGVVVFAGIIADRGVVSVDHPGGLRTTYEPVTALVKAGDPVRQGEAIALLDAGHLGCPEPACLHWGLKRDDVYLDPLLVVRPPRLRLKPLSG